LTNQLYLLAKERLKKKCKRCDNL